ncbi:hypothetical protein ACIQVT_21390 [Streptomyces sp. NPDC100445]|uniref:hypothetical protein n=1 Tax=Streptomyces sp. NPDC100445 TaxID=3366102 RepID=UPI003818DEC6
METSEPTAAAAVPGPDERVLQLNLSAPGLCTHGQVQRNGALVPGTVDPGEARPSRPGQAALDARTLSVGAACCSGTRRCAAGRDSRRARIAGRLDPWCTLLPHPGGGAPRAGSELWLREGPRVGGCLDLRRAQLEVLYSLATTVVAGVTRTVSRR